MQAAAPNASFPMAVATYASLLSVISTRINNYNGYQVLRINCSEDRVFQTIKDSYIQEDLDFLSPPSKTLPTDVLISPSQIPTIKSQFELQDIPYKILVEDLSNDIQYEKRNYVSNNVRAGMNWNYYHRLETMHSWMTGLEERYPSLVSIINLGKTTEQRDLKIIKISTGGMNKPAVWLDGGIHAREWVSPATVSFIANELISEATRYRRMKLVETFDWYIHPIMNPDGYEYSHEYDRMWRKTRSEGPGGFFFWCKGTDPNRNWDFQWGGKGTSGSPCSQTYRGEKPASEPEVKLVQDFVMSIKDQLKLFVTFHSYSQLILLPWGYDYVRTEDHEELMEVATKAAKALTEVHGTTYEVGPVPELLYPASGGSHDWAKGVAGVKFSYAFELRDKGERGFMLPANQINACGEETFAAVKSMAEDMIVYYNLATKKENPDNKLFSDSAT